MLLSKYMRLNCQILSPISETPELNGMKNFAIQNRVLQRDRVLQRRVLERYYCILFSCCMLIFSIFRECLILRVYNLNFIFAFNDCVDLQKSIEKLIINIIVTFSGKNTNTHCRTV